MSAIERRLRSWLLVACFLPGCGAATPTGATAASSTKLSGVVASLPVRAEYGTDPTPNPIRGGPLADDLAAKVRDHYSKLSLEGDGRLADMAMKVLVATEQNSETPSPPELDATARDTGFVGPMPAVFVVPRIEGKWDRLDEYLALSPDNIRFTRYGVVALDIEGSVVGAVALGALNVALEPVKRRVEPLERVSIRGTLASGYTKGEVAWTRPDGSTQRTPAGNGALAFETPPLQRGIHRLEILGVGPTGLEVLANMPIACGVESRPPEEHAEPVDESHPKDALFELVNRERQSAGLRRVASDSTLDEVAESHSKDMVDAHFFGHQSPTTGVVEDRLRARGLRLGMFGENVAKGPSMAASHAMLLSSPAHRAIIMNPRFTHVGIGVVAERSADPPLFAATEVFGAFPVPIADLDAAASGALDALNRARVGAKVRAVARAPVLSAAAREIADAILASVTANPNEVAGPILRRRLTGTHLRRPLVLSGLPLDPAELARDDRLKGAQLRSAGIAVVQTPSSTAPKANVVVFVLTE